MQWTHSCLESSGKVGDSGMEARVGSWLTMDIVVVECGVSLECVVKVIVEDQSYWKVIIGPLSANS